ncbi:hypothetical protein LVV98_26330, partial [Klebsiella pneumoniae]|nr:hypothetical protein [Klebsiella pneumoniae]
MNNDDYPWFRKRGYLHFDEPVSLKKAVKYVSSPEKIIKHSFLPFLGNDSNLLIVFYVQIVPDDFVMQLHR